jgi:predicted nucleotidyltransferase
MIKFGRTVPHDVERKLPALAARLAADRRVAAVWLFGSRARGEADALSDVDLAVLAAPCPGAELAEARSGWLDAAVDTLGTDEVSLVVLNGAPVAFRAQVMKDARLLFARAAELAADYELATVKEWLDFKPALEEYDRLLLTGAAAGRLR